MKVRVVKRTAVVPLPIAEAFRIFSDPRTAELLTPPSMRFRLTNNITAPIKAGTVLQYRFFVFLIPIRWRLRIESVEAPESFVYVQERGPFAHWRHQQFFSASSDRATQIRDRIEFVPPFGPLGEFVHQIFLRAKMKQLFEYRSSQMDQISVRGERRPVAATINPEPLHEPRSW